MVHVNITLKDWKLNKRGEIVMAWVAVDESGLEAIYEGKPYRAHDCIWLSTLSYVGLPSGSIKKLIGRDLSWSDEPVELK